MNSSAVPAQIEALLASIPDFPTPGILFRDLTPVFADAAAFRSVVAELVSPYVAGVGSDAGIDVVAGVEARGFLLAGAAAHQLDAGVVAVRKAGKLPGEVLSESYDLEYGSASLEMHPAATPGQRMLVLDDVLATGGTLAATVRLAEAAGYIVVGVAVVLELDGLGGRDLLPSHPVVSLLSVSAS